MISGVQDRPLRGLTGQRFFRRIDDEMHPAKTLPVLIVYTLTPAAAVALMVFDPAFFYDPNYPYLPWIAIPGLIWLCVRSARTFVAIFQDFYFVLLKNDRFVLYRNMDLGTELPYRRHVFFQRGRWRRDFIGKRYGYGIEVKYAWVQSIYNPNGFEVVTALQPGGTVVKGSDDSGKAFCYRIGVNVDNGGLLLEKLAAQCVNIERFVHRMGKPDPRYDEFVVPGHLKPKPAKVFAVGRYRGWWKYPDYDLLKAIEQRAEANRARKLNNKGKQV